MLKRSPLKRHTPLRARRNKPEVRIGRVTGKVRLSGAALEALRLRCWQLYRGICQRCAIKTRWEARFDGDPQAYDMAHIVSRGAGGSDTLDNVRTLCHECHMREHTKGLKG